MKTYFFVAISIFIFSNICWAQCQKDQNVLFFANGMFNSKLEAKKSLDQIQKIYELKFGKENFNKYQVAYNTDEPALIQLLQVYRQKSEEYGLGFWKWIKSFKGAESNQEIQKMIKEYYNEQRAHDKDLKFQIKTYEDYLKNGFQVITVAHSQGNFYTNFSFDQIKSEKTKMISVATPASSVFQNGPYFTFKSDGVISHIPSAFEPNREKSNPGLFDHEFVNHYLKEQQTHAEIIDSIHNAITLKSTEPSLNPKNGYLNDDMIPVIKWFNGILEKKSDLTPSDCMLTYALFSTYRLRGLTCEGRNFKALKTVLNACAEDLTETIHFKQETACSFYSGMEPGNPFEYFYPFERHEFFQKYPNCKIESVVEFKNKISIEAIQSAIKKADSLK